MPSYWWECTNNKCPEIGTQVDFINACGSKGITHFIWDILIPSQWNQSELIKKCSSCGEASLLIAYEFPREEPVMIHVKHIVGLGPFDDIYVPMMWETIPDGDKENTWIDFKYINGKNIWGLNKPAVFSKQDIKELFQLYQNKTGVLFP